MKVTVLGAGGMLGSMVTSVLSAERDFDVTATARRPDRRPMEGVRQGLLDVETATEEQLQSAIEGADWVVNAVGVIKPYIRDEEGTGVERAVRVNALFPQLLARAAAQAGARVLQIATDCVYSGVRGGYLESDPHDALDVYGKSKSLGEVRHPNLHHLRCSIIGPEPSTRLSLLEWFLGQPDAATLQGYVHHRWNGVTTLQFAEICRGLIRSSGPLPHLQHVVPADVVTKKELLDTLAQTFGRTDVSINPVSPGAAVDRTLSTSNTEHNRTIWRLAGHAEPPTVAAMIAALAERATAEKIAAG